MFSNMESVAPYYLLLYIGFYLLKEHIGYLLFLSNHSLGKL